MLRDRSKNYKSAKTAQREEAQYLFEESRDSTSSGRHTLQRSSESHLQQRDGDDNFNNLHQSRTEDSLISTPRTDPFATSAAATGNAAVDIFNFTFPWKARSDRRSDETLSADSPSRSSHTSREKQLAARKKAIERVRKRNNAMSRKIDLMMADPEASYDEEDTSANNSTADSTESNGSGKPSLQVQFRLGSKTFNSGELVCRLSCSKRFVWSFTRIIVVLITCGVVAYFVATAQSTSESESDPILIEDCGRVRSGSALIGQELLIERQFDIIMDVEMAFVRQKEKTMDLLEDRIQKYMMPELVGYCEGKTRKLRDSYINPDRFIVGNGKVQWLPASLQEDSECSSRTCLSVTFNMDLFLRTSEVKYSVVVDLIEHVFAGELIYPLQLQSLPFISVVVRTVVNKNLTPTPTSTPSLVPTAASSQKPTESAAPSQKPTELPSNKPTLAPSVLPSRGPTISPTASPTTTPSTSLAPTTDPTPKPTPSPTMLPSESPTTTVSPSGTDPTPKPTPSPTMLPSESPSTTISPTRNQDGYFQPLDRPIRVSCAGDSLTRGTYGGVPWQQTYPSQLQQLFGEDFEIYNFGRNAMAALRGLGITYVDKPQFEASLNADPDIYLLMLGTNDARYWETHGHQYRGDMEWIVNMVRSISMESPPRVIVAIPPWVQKDGAFGIRNEVLVNGVHPEIQTLTALDENVQLVNMYDVTYNQADMFLDDGLHLNGVGAGALAAAWKLAIECNQNGVCEVGENCATCPLDCSWNCS